MSATVTHLGNGQILGTAKKLAWGKIASNNSTSVPITNVPLTDIEAAYGPSVTAVSISGNTITLTTANSANGYWFAIGK